MEEGLDLVVVPSRVQLGRLCGGGGCATLPRAWMRPRMLPAGVVAGQWREMAWPAGVVHGGGKMRERVRLEI